jgi:hypothetical protein
MIEKRPFRELVDNLISQDAGISESQLEEKRVSLMNTLADLERRAQKIRKASFIACGAFVACILAVLPLEIFQLTRVPWVAPLWAVCGSNIALFTAGILVTLYTYKYRPALRRGRSDLQTMMIMELHREIVELKNRLEADER